MSVDWRIQWEETDRRHREARDSQGAILELFERYSRLTTQERRNANAVIFEALQEGSDTQRYDALAIINEFRVREALPYLRELAARLQLDDSASAPFELAKVQRFISKLGSASED
jgi:hypothetical protein